MLVQQLSSLFICRIIMEKDRLLPIQQSIINIPSLLMGKDSYEKIKKGSRSAARVIYMSPQ